MKFDPRNVSGHYVLVGQTPVLERDLLTWAAWFETADRRVAEDFIGPYRVSTVFLGLDYGFGAKGPPLIFETMVFSKDEEHGFRARARTWREAEEIHRAVAGRLILKYQEQKQTK